MNWDEFINSVPDRVKSVIENGPLPQTEYNGTGSKLTSRDKRMGIMRFKGGKNNIKAKRGYKGVVYYDPTFAYPEYQVSDIPDKIEERHSEDNVIEEFKKL